MKRYFSRLILAGAMLLAGGGMVGCDKDDPTPEPVVPSFAAELVSTETDSAKVKLTSENLAEYAYQVVEAADAAKPAAEAVFEAGVKGTLKDGQNDVTISSLAAQTDYVAYFAARTADGIYYKDVVEVKFTTVDSPAVFAVEVTGQTQSTVSVKINSVKIAEYAYLAYTPETLPETAPNATVLFATGTTGALADGENQVDIVRLNPATAYTIYFAAKTTGEEFFGDVLKVEATTDDFTEAVEVFDVDYRSFKVSVKVPENLKADDHMLKWGTSSIFLHNLNAQGGGDFINLNLNDEYYKTYFNEDRIFTVDDYNSVMRDENGEPILDGQDYIEYYVAPVPGQPQRFSVGEFARGEHPWGWGEGYYAPMFDEEAYWTAVGGGGGDDWGPLMAGTRAVNEADFWTGFYDSKLVVLKAPEKLDAKFEVEMSLRPNGGLISVRPDSKIQFYQLMLLDEYTLAELMPLLDNNPDYLQWFTTSYEAVINLGVATESGPVDIMVEEFFGVVDPQVKYHLFLVGMGNENGTLQCFETHEFNLPEPTKPAPSIEVTGIEKPASEGEASPFEVWFNVKCTSNDATVVRYAANYEREWETTKKQYGFDDAQLLEMADNRFSSDDVAAINSAEGLNVRFDSYEDAVTVMGAMASNDEGTWSEAVVTKNRSMREPDAERVESDLFTALNGDWTATATITYTKYDENRQPVPVTETKTCKVTLGDLTAPATLPESVYALYPDMTRDEVDALFADFKSLQDVFNQKTRGQNRILCNGFDFEVPRSQGGRSDLSYQSPFELFCSTTYNGYDNASLLWDFGPKWYLQVAADGTVTAPFNMGYFAPASQWTKSAYYMVASDGKAVIAGDETTGFPVEVSADRNTITVKPFVQGETEYFPVLAQLYTGGNFQYGARVTTDIVLTRGWNEAATVKSAVTGGKISACSVAGERVKLAKKPMSRTIMALTKPAPRAKGHGVTVEQFRKNLKNTFDKLCRVR
mgnify:CR=1 FL=1